MDNVADQPDFGLEELLLLSGLGEQFLLLRLDVGWDISAPCSIHIVLTPPTFLLQEISDVLLCLFESVRIGRSREVEAAHAFFLGPICF